MAKLSFNPLGLLQQAAAFVRNSYETMRAQDDAEYALFKQGYTPAKIVMASNANGGFDGFPVTYRTPRGDIIQASEYLDLRDRFVARLLAFRRHTKPESKIA